jgi:hypothetical protein
MAKIEWRLNVQDPMAQKSGGRNGGKILGLEIAIYIYIYIYENISSENDFFI